MGAIEIERKALLTKEIYDKFCNGVESKKFTQENFYFDCNNILKDNEVALRIRVKNDSYKFTIKDKKYDDGNHYYIEVDQRIDKQIFNLFLETGILPDGEIKNYFNENSLLVEKFSLLTKITTHRIVKEFDDYTLFLDHNEFDSFSDYELEIEAINFEVCNNVFTTICGDYNLEENTATKLYRALNC